ncbi:hypothetical protein [Lepagella muris]|uniref:Uncharacterized protein n=1 Tax=Lepagella muris TaxID=3032870 RepID=A0AC61RIQ7_9BACT|nr:hypothetical protein [Lepagella muris]TGY80893.1 hypothetical protein E5331_00510 [Lepagella muris]THG53971.1 hypothetical protein E5984_00510 [Bacteroidales bacterium]TKC57400.1 hypothetical protein E5359_012095 [Bacteroidales bacterium]
MKEITAYRCQHCGKVYLKRHACQKHEDERCPENVEIRPLCYSCVHYAPDYDDENKERIEFVDYVDSYFGTEHYSIKLFSPNKCTYPKCTRKLFNNINLSQEMRKGLAESEYYPMPTPRTGGCPFYKVIPDHHHTNK